MSQNSEDPRHCEIRFNIAELESARISNSKAQQI